MDEHGGPELVPERVRGGTSPRLAALAVLVVLGGIAWLAASGRSDIPYPEAAPPPAAVVASPAETEAANRRANAAIVLLTVLGFMVAVDVVALMYGFDSRAHRNHDYWRE
ncbi:MAG: hypothetical protein M3253_01825 [Chloroflexota bacterium]|nr:hypothetical protein [Chloroflexota bacterium]